MGATNSASTPTTPRSQAVWAAVKAVIEQKRPFMVEQFCKAMRDAHAHLQTKFGPTLFRSRYDWSFKPTEGVQMDDRDKAAFARVSPVTVQHPDTGARDIDEKALQDAASRHVDQTFEAVVAKILHKAGELEDPVVHALSGLQFNLTGVMNGRSVLIEQTIILNQSVLGKWFNQYPARIYLDGKLTSEAKFKQAMAPT